MIEKKQIEHIRRELIGRIRAAVEKEGGCIGTFYMNKGRRFKKHDIDGEIEYEEPISVGIHDTLPSSPADYESILLLELFIDPKDHELCCAFEMDNGIQFDLSIEVVITDSLPKIVDWLGEHGFISVCEDVTLYCSECGRTNTLIMAWVKPNEGKMFDSDIGGNGDEESCRCEFCEKHVELLDEAQMTEEVDSWWGKTEFKEMEGITRYRQDDFSPEDGYQDFVDACETFWNNLTLEQKIEKWRDNK